MTAITVELDEKTIQALRSLSQLKGSDMPRLVSELLKSALFFQNDSETDSAAEIDLIMQTRQELPATLWRRYRQLTRKRRNESLTEDEYTELITLERLEKVQESCEFRPNSSQRRANVGLMDRFMRQNDADEDFF